MSKSVTIWQNVIAAPYLGGETGTYPWPEILFYEFFPVKSMALPICRPRKIVFFSTLLGFCLKPKTGRWYLNWPGDGSLQAGVISSYVSATHFCSTHWLLLFLILTEHFKVERYCICSKGAI